VTVAKTRAQRKAEQRRRQERALQERAREQQAKAQQQTQVPESADVIEAELAERGADLEELKGAPAQRRPTDGQVAEAERELVAAAPSRADVGAPAEEVAPSRRERRRAERERRQRAKESAERRQARVETPERKRGAVVGFLLSCWAELKRVQWPNRETLVQASAVTLLFIAVAAAYLGALDAVFSWIVQRIL
jgi:preprotein translocase SecE subunit